MGEVYYRMNTVFKFYLPAWILMASSGFAMLAVMLEQPVSHLKIGKDLKRAALIGVTALLLTAPLIIPFEYSSRDATLNGLAWLDTTHPGDAEAIAFLRSLSGSYGIVEAEGEITGITRGYHHRPEFLPSSACHFTSICGGLTRGMVNG
ncbi:MAG TPA: hypothetical protein PK955_04775, partial [Methanoregulaceae archaeon]|nr:hypothetical protein [Methanoregulaceae archaeon]